jgi:hypothetical protein
MKKSMSKKAILGLVVGMLFVVTGCKSTPAPVGIQPGDKVVALWSGSSWYEGIAEATCDKGFSVKWNDGTPASCVVAEKVLANKEATKENAKVGTAVFAKWSGVAFYDGKISAVNGDKYNVDFTDGTKKADLSLSELRLK